MKTHEEQIAVLRAESAALAQKRDEISAEIDAKVRQIRAVCVHDGKHYQLEAETYCCACDALIADRRPVPGTTEYDDETELMQEAADAMRHLPKF